MGILPILSILYALVAVNMATAIGFIGAVAPAQPNTLELSKKMDDTLNGALAKSEDIASDNPVEKQEEEVADALGDDDEAAEAEDAAADTPEHAGFDLEVTDALEDDTAEVDELQGEDSEALDGDEDVAAENHETPADAPAPAELEEALSKARGGVAIGSTGILPSGPVGQLSLENQPAGRPSQPLSQSHEWPIEYTSDSKGSIEKRVVGGHVSSWTLWRWQVSLQYKSGCSKWRHTCGGFLVKRNWVMTAAHCVDSRRTYRVVAGERALNSRNGREQYLSVYRIYRHPSWNKRVASGNDIALLRLRTYATVNRYVQLAVLPPANQGLSTRTTCYVSGWGRTSTRGSISNQLRYAHLKVVSYSTCRNRYWWGTKVKSNMICAGGNGRQAGCSGDSGGPLNCWVGRKYVVHGITSFVSSRGCNVARKPTVFTRVSAHMCWIRSRIGA